MARFIHYHVMALPPHEVGNRIRGVREQESIGIPQIADALNVEHSVVIALEADHLDPIRGDYILRILKCSRPISVTSFLQAKMKLKHALEQCSDLLQIQIQKNFQTWRRLQSSTLLTELD